MNPRSNLTLIVLTVILALGALSASAESVPKLINYQGKLTDSTGVALQDGEYSVRFALFDAPADGTLVWGEIRTVSLVKGVFNVALGAGSSGTYNPDPAPAVNTIGFAFGSAERYLQTTVVSGPNIAAEQLLSPRQQMMSVPYAVEASNGVPPGTVVSFAGPTIPDGWLLCDGSSYPASNPRYAALAEAIGNTYGTGLEGEFRVPDLRGEFLRGLDAGRGVDPGRSAGSSQGFATARPTNAFVTSTNGNHSHAATSYRTNGANVNEGRFGGASDFDYARGARTANAGSHNHTISSGGDVETRPRNVAMNYMIKL